MYPPKNTFWLDTLGLNKQDSNLTETCISKIDKQFQQFRRDTREAIATAVENLNNARECTSKMLMALEQLQNIEKNYKKYIYALSTEYQNDIEALIESHNAEKQRHQLELNNLLTTIKKK